MRVLFVDCCITGHHIPYLKAVANKADDYFFILPKKIPDFLNDKQMICLEDLKSFYGYRKWLFHVEKTAKEKKVDVIHFLYGDIFYRFFGMGLNKFKDYKVVCTFHHIRKGFLHDISLIRIFSFISKGIVHTNCLKDYVYSKGIRNAEKIEYPVFEEVIIKDSVQSKVELGLKPSVQTFLYFGETRYDKGLDILLEALKGVMMPIQLIIAGKTEYFTEKFIKDELTDFKGEIKLLLRFIKEEEIPLLFSAADCVVLPYRKIFDGASGPLGIGCMYRKRILGPSHGSIGMIITTNHLGGTFCAEDVQDLTKAIEKIGKNKFVYDKLALEYCKRLDPSLFEESYKELYYKRL